MSYCWKTEFEVKDADGDAVEWFDSQSEAIERAKALGGSVIKIQEYLTERDVIFENGAYVGEAGEA